MMWDHVQDVYKAMLERAEEEPTEFEDTEGDPHENIRNVYTGHLTSLFGELQKPAPYYTSIMTALKAMGCVEQLRRGGGSAPSKWIMQHPPTEEGYMAFINNRSTKKPHGKVEMLEQQVKNLMGRVQHIEEHLATQKG
jgi:ribosomal protein S15P/S13E